MTTKQYHNIWLDDVRLPPKGWIWVTTDVECIEMIKSIQKKGDGIGVMSLDHDLGETCGSGYDVICWLEEQVICHSMSIPNAIAVHSANPVGRKKMEHNRKHLSSPTVMILCKLFHHMIYF